MAFLLQPGAFGFRTSNPPVLQCAALLASLEVFEEAGGMEALREKSVLLTAYLEALLMQHLRESTILSPKEADQRGCQLSIKFAADAELICEKLARKGVVVDARKPDVVRIAPTPLYNSFSEVRRAVLLLEEAVGECKATN